MIYLLIAAAGLLGIILFCLAVSAVCFFEIFYFSKPKMSEGELPSLPDGETYAPHREQIFTWIKDTRAMTHKEVSVTSFDGLRLYGKYYEYQKGAPIEILFHGYKGSSERELCGGVARCFALGHNALMIDHRACGKSEGRVITFGVKESRDCLTWVDFVLQSIDPNASIILTGISMGAATVMIASAADLPPNVIGVLADCGYTSARDVIKKVMRDRKLPADLLYPFARLGAILFGGFDPDETSPLDSMKKCRLPVIFFHGDQDGYVPCEMSEKNHAACASSRKRLVMIHGADHGLCFPADQSGYLEELKHFFGSPSDIPSDTKNISNTLEVQ